MLSRKGVWVVLVVILLFSALFRLYDIQWDSGIMAHPDERSTVAFYAPTIEWPSSLAEALDPQRSPLNPFWDRSNSTRRSYTYGHFPLYLLILVGNFLHLLAPIVSKLGAPGSVVGDLLQANTVSGFFVVGRTLTGLFDVGMVFVVFLIARKLYGSGAGLLAAALSAFTVTQIQLAHFFAVDPISAFFTFLTLYGAILMTERDSTPAALLTGLAAGLAVASKFSALPVMAAPVVATLIASIARRREKRSIGGTWMRLVLTCLVAFMAFTVTSPYVFLDFDAFFRAVVKEQGDMVRGVADFPFTRQYRGTLPYIYFIEQEIRWGMGPALGLVGLAGLIWVLTRGVLGRIKGGELILLSWIIPYFGFTGLFLAKFMRYMSPVVPLLTVMGAGLLVALWRRGSRPGAAGRTVRGVAVLLIVLTLLASMLWTLAFVNGVYGSEHPWVQASRWIYANVPDGAALGLEHWDDHLPVGLPEERANMGAHNYRVVEFPMYEEDTQQKFEQLKENVRNSNYIILSSNRLYRTIPRLPQRYPMSTRYYQALFSGQLGFEKVAEFTAYPRLGPLVIKDDDADESFTVYDHPKPMIFKKVRDLSEAEWEQVLDRTWENAEHGYVGEKPLLARLLGDSFEFPNIASFLESSQVDRDPKKTLLLDQPVDTLPVVDDFRWNKWASGSTMGAVVFWWLVVQLVGWLGWPLTFTVFRKLSDRGHMLSKSLTLLLVAYLVWLPASFRLARNDLVFIGPAFGLVALLSLALLWRNRSQVRTFWRDHWKLVVLNELVFTGAYLLFVGIRLLNPDLWQPWLGGEKFMDFAFLNAVLKSAYFPPYDPYFAGGYMNYYYYGQYVVGILMKLAGIVPTIAFNLVIPTLFALTVGNSFCLGYNLLASGRKNKGQALAAGFTASFFVAVIGNLDGFLQLWRRLGEIHGTSLTSSLPLLQDTVRGVSGLAEVLTGGAALPAYNYWDPTRVIPYTINEFPYFSFLYADLHPHMINIAFALLFMALMLNLVLKPQTEVESASPAICSEDSVTDTAPTEAAAATSPIADEDMAPALTPAEAAATGDLVTAASIVPEDALATEITSPDVGTESEPEKSISAGAAVEEGFLARWSLWDWIMLPLVLGALAAINTWDFPTYWGLAVLTFFFGRFWQDGRLSWIRTAIFGGLLAGISLLLYWPFFAHYQAISVGLGLVSGSTDLGKFLSIWGLFLFIVASFVFAALLASQTRSGAAHLVSLILRRWSVLPHLVGLYRRLVHNQESSYRLACFVVVVVSICAAGLALLGYWVIALLVLLLAPTFLLLTRQEAQRGQQFAVLLTLAALAVLIGVEVVYMRDFLGGSDWKRMNTLFKFYIQVWLFLGIACAAFVVWLTSLVERWRSALLRAIWTIALLILGAATLVYPLLGTAARVNDRFPGARPPIGTLDGMAYMTVGSYTWPDENNRIALEYDYDGIRWLMDHLTGTPVIAEANLGYYREGGLRVSSMTGFPTLLGMHQSEQRYDWQVGERDGLVRELYDSPSAKRATQIIDELGISYIYSGKLERTVYNPVGLAKFDQMAEQGQLQLVYENPEVKIYRVQRANGSNTSINRQ